MDLRKPTGSSQVSLWNLPEELLLCILKSLHIKDVLNMRAVNSIFRDLIDDCSAVWKEASFQDTWPSATNFHYFEKAGKFGNMEALIKMALAHRNYLVDWTDPYVYNIELRAAQLFCQIEAMTPFEPFTWIFIRPPYLPLEDVYDSDVMKYMTNSLQKNNKQDTKNLNVCVAKCLLLLNLDDSIKVVPYLFEKRADVFLSNAKQLGSGCAAFVLWQMEYHDILSTHRARQLEGIRQLQEIAKMNYFDSKLSLCKYYARGMYGGITPKQAAMYVQELVQSTTPANTQECLETSQELTNSMRCILVNWLVDIARWKNFSSHTLHVTVCVVDRYLKRHTTTRSELKFVGVAAMALCSRFLEKDILTIYEVNFLEEFNEERYTLVNAGMLRMMAEITATLKGNIRVPTSLDFVEIFSSVAELDEKCSCLAEYVCELTLLHAEMGQYSPAEIAASSVLLARLLMKLDMWPDKMIEFSGFTIEGIRRCVFHVHEKCFLQEPVVDGRGVKLQAVKLWYAKEKFHKVSEIPIMGYEELCAMLGVTCILADSGAEHCKP